MTAPLKVGTLAPDFTASGSDGKVHRLSEMLADSRVLLIFYPGNNTPG